MRCGYQIKMSDSEEEVAVLGGQEVTYCPECSLPPEYCEFSPCFESDCVPWIKENVPELIEKFTSLGVIGGGDDDENDGDDDDEGDDKKKKKSKRDKRDKKGKSKKQKDEESKKSKMGNPCILVKLEQRNKRKCVTIVKGMDSVDTGMTIKKCAQKFSKRFACSASVQKTKEGPEIHVQGDIMWDIGEFLIETFEVDSSVLYKLGKGNIKKKLM